MKALYILLIILILAILCPTIIIFYYYKWMKKYYEQSEDKAGLYDFIHIKDNIINVDHIVNIRQIQSVQSINEENYKIIIELDNSKEPLCFDFDNDWKECNDVFEQIQTLLDAANIIAD